MKFQTLVLLALQAVVGSASKDDILVVQGQDASAAKSSTKENVTGMGNTQSGEFETASSSVGKGLVGDNSNHGMIGKIPLSPKEQCAVYQDVSNTNMAILDKIGLNPLYRPIPELPLAKTNRKLTLKKHKSHGSGIEGSQEGVGVDLFDTDYVNAECLDACGVTKVCPETCKGVEDIEHFCDCFDDVTSFDANCPFCPETCRIDCLSWVARCCPCAPAINVINQYPGIVPDAPENPDDDLGLGIERFNEPYYDWYVDNGAEMGPYLDTFGVGLEFKEISTAAFSCGSILVLYPFRPAERIADKAALFDDGYTNTYSWLHNANPAETEDEVAYKGDEVLSSGSAYKKKDDPFWKLVFRDSQGFHISEQSFKLKQYGKIYAASPEMKYNYFDPYQKSPSTGTMGKTLGPSTPSFDCITAVGYQLNAIAKLVGAPVEPSYKAIMKNFSVEMKPSTLPNPVQDYYSS